MIDPERAELLLVWVLRLSGAVLVLAFGALFLPLAWITKAHADLGFGPLPETPVFEYLARSISALYGCRGVVYFALARDIRRFLPLVVLFGWLDVIFGLTTLTIDLKVGMPWWWVLVEGPGVLASGIVMLVLVGILRRTESA